MWTLVLHIWTSDNSSISPAQMKTTSQFSVIIWKSNAPLKAWDTLEHKFENQWCIMHQEIRRSNEPSSTHIIPLYLLYPGLYFPIFSSPTSSDIRKYRTRARTKTGKMVNTQAIASWSERWNEMQIYANKYRVISFNIIFLETHSMNETYC